MEKRKIGKHIEDENNDTLEIMQFNPIIEEDETDQRKSKAIEHLAKLKNNRKILVVVIVVLLLLLLIIYFVSPISKVNDINIVGNKYLNDKEILKMTHLDYGDYTIDVSTSKIKKAIMDNNPLVNKVTVDKEFGGTINIQLDVSRVVAYYDSGKNVKLLKSNGESVTLKNSIIDTLPIPYLSNMRESEYQQIAKELKGLSDSQLSMISEIRPYKNNYGIVMVEIIMNDNHMVRVGIKGIHLMKSYNKIIEKLNSDLRCINIIEETNSAYSEKC